MEDDSLRKHLEYVATQLVKDDPCRGLWCVHCDRAVVRTVASSRRRGCCGDAARRRRRGCVGCGGMRARTSIWRNRMQQFVAFVVHEDH